MRTSRLWHLWSVGPVLAGATVGSAVLCGCPGANFTIGDYGGANGTGTSTSTVTTPLLPQGQ